VPRRLLIVEQLPDIGRAYARSLCRYDLEEVVIAATPQEAESFLDRSEGVCLVCGHSLGQLTGAELVARWRRRYPGLEKAVLVTGTDSTVARSTPGIDAVFAQPPDMEAVARALGLERRSAAT
jgi:DNA-binding NtrC family response regulator